MRRGIYEEAKVSSLLKSTNTLGRGDNLTFALASHILLLARHEMRRSVRHFKHFVTPSSGEMCGVPKGFDQIGPFSTRSSSNMPGMSFLVAHRN